MTDMFIPPTGAMQFEMTDGRSALTKRMIGTAIWIESNPTPVERCKNDVCACQPKYRVIVDSLPDFARDAVKLALTRGVIDTPPVVCTCIGRIIE